MKIISTNIAKPKFVTINGKQQRTGIFKEPTNEPIYLDKEEVKGDEITNRKVHGGIYKACYLFSADHYSHWKHLYPDVDWHYGMLGENLTVEGLDETKIMVGDIYKIGDALVQITQPREPCTTFAAKMGTPEIMQQFVEHGKPGTYVRVLESGHVAMGDEIRLIERATNSLSISQFFELIFTREKDKTLIELVTKNEALSPKKRAEYAKYLAKL